MKRQPRRFSMTYGGLMGVYEPFQDAAQREILLIISLSTPSSSCLTLVFYMSFILVHFLLHLCCSLSFHSLVFVIHILLSVSLALRTTFAFLSVLSPYFCLQYIDKHHRSLFNSDYILLFTVTNVVYFYCTKYLLLSLGQSP